MQKYLKVFYVLCIIVAKCSLSLQSSLDSKEIVEKFEKLKKNEDIIKKLQWQIEQEEKHWNFAKVKNDTKNRISKLENQLNECETHTKSKTENSLSSILQEIKKLQSNRQDNEKKFKQKDEIIASLQTQLDNQSKTLNLQIIELTKANEAVKNLIDQIAEYKLKIEKKEIEIKNLEWNNSDASSKLKDCKYQLQSLESNKISYKSAIDKKDAEISKLETSLKQTSRQASLTKCNTDLQQMNEMNDESQKQLKQCQSVNTDCEMKVEDMHIKSQKDDQDRRTIQTSLSVCEEKLQRISRTKNQDVYNAQSTPTECKKSNAAIQNQLSELNAKLLECQQREKSTTLTRPQSCLSSSDGLQEIELPNMEPFQVLCNKDIVGPGWMIIERRFDGRLEFNKPWNEYVEGFGQLHGEFFIGLEKLHIITKSQPHKLYIQITDIKNQVFTVEYDNFRIGNSSTKYKLESIGKFKGNSVDSLLLTVNMKFSTYDKQNGCSRVYGGWWRSSSCRSGYYNLNGNYFKRILWLYQDENTNKFISCKTVYMMIRPNFAP